MIPARTHSSCSHQRRIQSYSYRIKPSKSNKKHLQLDRTAQQYLQPFKNDLKKCFNKIGTKTSRNTKNQYQPSKQQRKSFQTLRYSQLKYDLLQRKRKKVPFEFQMDQIVLDCYNYKESYGKHSIWKKYRGEVDQLSYQVLRIKNG